VSEASGAEVKSRLDAWVSACERGCVCVVDVQCVCARMCMCVHSVSGSQAAVRSCCAVVHR
jgi:hypothetical protein